MTRVIGTLHEDKYTFLIISRSALLRITVVEKIKTLILCSNPPPPPENHAVYEIMWKSVLEPGRPQMTVWRMRIACWIYIYIYIRLQTHTHFN